MTETPDPLTVSWRFGSPSTFGVMRATHGDKTGLTFVIFGRYFFLLWLKK